MITDSAPNMAHSASVLLVHSKPTETPLTKESVLKNYSDIFQGLGKFPGEPYKLRLKPDSTPAKHRPRKVPLHLQDAFHEEVKRLVEIDVLEPVNEPTEWVNSFVVVEKQVNIDSSSDHSPGHYIKKKIQLCIDPKDLNKALERKLDYTKSIDEPIAKSSGTNFTNVDTSKDYLQVIIYQESRKQEVRYPPSRDYICKTFKISRFQWKQLPMGTVVAVEIFQRTLKLKVPLQELIQRDIHKPAFTCTKSEFSTKFTLQCFSKDKETFLQTDASKKGFHPVLIHKNASASTKSEYALSRVSSQDIEPDIEQESPIFAVNTLTNFQEGEEKMALKLQTAKDPELSALHKLISEGWPPKRSSVPDNLKDYWNYRDELTVEDGILLKNRKFIVPKNLQLVYIDKIHAGHLGINKSLQKPHEYLFWNGYTKDIIEAIDKCAICQEHASSNPQHFQYISEVPPHPWHTLGTDIFYHRKQDYLVLINYFSKFLIVRKLPNSTTGAVVKELSITVSEYGIQLIIQSDNGPCYSSQEFKTFLQDLQITHCTSSPHYP